MDVQELTVNLPVLFRNDFHQVVYHSYRTNSCKIFEYVDSVMDNLISHYIDKKEIAGFKIEDIKLQIFGKFINEHL